MAIHLVQRSGGDSASQEVVAEAVESSTTTTTTSSTTTTTTTTVPPEEEAIAEVLAELDDATLARQLVIVGVDGPNPAAQIADALTDTCLGGVFITSSFGNFAPASSLAAAAEAIADVSAVPDDCVAAPVIATDAEAGTTVLRVPVSPLLAPTALAEQYQGDPVATLDQLSSAADGFAAELADVGVHVNFGVVGDVDVADTYYMARRGRTFGGDPDAVTALTQTLVASHCRAGVAATLKHFPNQGSTPEDPHQADSFSTNDRQAWESFGALPYRDTDAPLVMVGHIRYSDMEDATPATLSSTIVTGWLRTGLGYDGVVVTDDLSSMVGVGNLPVGERAVAALRAGSDLALLVDLTDIPEVLAAIEAELAADPGFAAQAMTSFERVLRLKAALGLVPTIDSDWVELCPAAG